MSALLRFLQETATRASTDAGFDPGYYERAQRMWLVRRTMLILDGYSVVEAVDGETAQVSRVSDALLGPSES